jgi:DNA-3-methyladenine glycosylase I
LIEVASYYENDINNIIGDQQMIRHEGKIRGCVKNAKSMLGLIEKYGSFKNYIATFGPYESFDNITQMGKSLKSQFAFLGGVTVYHFMTDIGVPVLKPDRVICRIFTRLGLLENEGQELAAILQGRKFAETTEFPIRYIDRVFVAHGQVKSEEIGITKGICLKEPRCEECSISKYCAYFQIRSIQRARQPKSHRRRKG